MCDCQDRSSYNLLVLFLEKKMCHTELHTLATVLILAVAAAGIPPTITVMTCILSSS